MCTGNAECYLWRSADGRYLFFASINLGGPPRPGHQGMWDIYISEWDSLNQCRRAASGSYIYQLESGVVIQTQKVFLLQ